MWYPIAEDLLYKHLPVIVNAWYPGEQGGTAVAEVLFGDYNPAGRLPLTYYKFLEELPPFDDYDITKGRTYQYFKKDVLYPFGDGLSYTTFKYSNLEVTDAGKTVNVSMHDEQRAAGFCRVAIQYALDGQRRFLHKFRRGVPVGKHIIHGILHLCGINDKGPGEREIMEAAENKALEMRKDFM